MGYRSVKNSLNIQSGSKQFSSFKSCLVCLGSKGWPLSQLFPPYFLLKISRCMRLMCVAVPHCNTWKTAYLNPCGTQGPGRSEIWSPHTGTKGAKSPLCRTVSYYQMCFDSGNSSRQLPLRASTGKCNKAGTGQKGPSLPSTLPSLT